MNTNIHPIFILAYDMIGDQLKENGLACGEAFRVCEEVYKDFLQSKYNDPNWSEYECLDKFVWYADIQDYIDKYPYLKSEGE